MGNLGEVVRDPMTGAVVGVVAWDGRAPLTPTPVAPSGTEALAAALDHIPAEEREDDRARGAHGDARRAKRIERDTAVQHSGRHGQ